MENIFYLYFFTWPAESHINPLYGTDLPILNYSLGELIFLSSRTIFDRCSILTAKVAIITTSEIPAIIVSGYL